MGIQRPIAVRLALTLIGIVLVVASGCGPGAATGPGVPSVPDSEVGRRPAGVKRVTIAYPREMDLSHHRVQNKGILWALVNPGLSVVDDRDVRRPALAQAVPTLENGLWKVFPDGRMETTWTIREGVRWHDGTPFTTDDLLFTTTLGRDRELAILNNTTWSAVEEVVALDQRTITARWKEPNIEADHLFSVATTKPLPRHKLESLYRESEADFASLSFWLQDYVGTGPFRVRAWDPSTFGVLEANPAYVLGRPKIDEIEVRFILDGNTLTAAVLAGTIDIAKDLGSVDRAFAVRDRWRDGKVVFQLDLGGGPWLHPQFLNPHPVVMLDLQFRRALLHAIDRQTMADTLGRGIGPVAHSILNPGQPEYHEIEAPLPRYEYDPRRAVQLIEGLGYSLQSESFGGSGRILRDPAGQPPHIEVRSGPEDAAGNAGASVADYWERIGIETSLVRETGRLAQDPEARATFPGVLVTLQPKDVMLRNLYSSHARLPENGFRGRHPPTMPGTPARSWTASSTPTSEPSRCQNDSRCWVR